MYTWEDIRSNWVNGNRKDTRETLKQMNKTHLFKIFLQAITAHRTYEQNGGSGDLQDLFEILTSLNTLTRGTLENRTYDDLENLEIFYENDPNILKEWSEQNEEPPAPGYYFWFCFPGCLPDSEPIGPYETENEAYEAAKEMFSNY